MENASHEELPQDQQVETQEADATGEGVHEVLLSPPPILPEPSFDSSLSLQDILGTVAEAEKVQKRASNVMKLSQENEKLNAELKEMSERLEAAERRRQELLAKREGRTGTSPVPAADSTA